MCAAPLNHFLCTRVGRSSEGESKRRQPLTFWAIRQLGGELERTEIGQDGMYHPLTIFYFVPLQ